MKSSPPNPSSNPKAQAAGSDQPDQVLAASDQDSCAELSALMDGALDGEAVQLVLRRLEQDDSLAATWDNYHLLGQALRVGHACLRPHDPAFVLRLRQRLSQEQKPVPETGAPSPGTDSTSVMAPAANDDWWRSAASLGAWALAALLLWQGWLWLGAGPVQLPTLAQSSSLDLQLVNGVQMPVANQAPAVVMLRDAQLDALLAAHRQAGGAAALHGSAGFLRDATFSEDRP